MSLGIPLNPLSLVGSLVSAQQAPTATQKASAAASIANGISSTSPFSNLNLTSTEQAQISAIMKGSQGQPFSQIASSIEQVLSPSQQKTFESDIQSMQMRSGGHHHHGGGGGGASSASTIDSGTDAFGVASTTNAPSATSTPASSSLFSEMAAMFSAQSQTQQNPLFDV
jgi:hypothetical protein